MIAGLEAESERGWEEDLECLSEPADGLDHADSDSQEEMPPLIDYESSLPLSAESSSDEDEWRTVHSGACHTLVHICRTQLLSKVIAPIKIWCATYIIDSNYKPRDKCLMAFLFVIHSLIEMAPLYPLHDPVPGAGRLSVTTFSS